MIEVYRQVTRQMQNLIKSYEEMSGRAEVVLEMTKRSMNSADKSIRDANEFFKNRPSFPNKKLIA